jgi:TolB protein
MKRALIFLSVFSLCVMTNAQIQRNIESSLVLLDIASGKEEVILKEQRHFEAPNWSRDGKYLVINSNGLLEKISINGEKLGIINTGFANRCNNDHGFSFDGKTLVISHNDTAAAKGNNSRVFVLPAEGGTPKLVTQKFPSYWHGGMALVPTDKRWCIAPCVIIITMCIRLASMVGKKHD